MPIGTSPFALIDSDVLAAFTGFTDLTALVPAAHVRMAGLTIQATELDKANVLRHALMIQPGDMRIEPEKGSDGLARFVFPYEVRIFGANNDLNLTRDVSYQALRAVIALGKRIGNQSNLLTPRLPLYYVSIPMRSIAVLADTDNKKAHRSILRFEVVCHSSADDVLIRPTVFEANYATSPNRHIDLLCVQGEANAVLAAVNQAAGDPGWPFSIKDSGGAAISFNLADTVVVVDGDTIVTINITSATVPHSITYNGGGLIRSKLGAEMESFTDRDIDNV